MIKVVFLIISIVAKGQSLNGWPKLPPGTMVEQREADHKPAWDANTDNAQRAGYRCVEVDLLPTSAT